jgi:hypothetical protein
VGRKETPVKRILIVFALLTVFADISRAQAGHAGQENNLRGLKGVRLIVLFNQGGALEETERASISKLVEDDAIAKLQRAGVTLFHFANEVTDAGSPQLIIYITCDKANGFVYPLVTELKLLQRVRLIRDPSIEADLATWQQRGIGGPTLSVSMIRDVVGTEIDQFINDYIAVNSITKPQ